MSQKLRRFSCFRLSSHKLGDLHQDDLNTDTADKSPHHRRGDEIHDPACLQKIKQQKPQAGKQRHHRHKGHGFRRAAHNAKRGDRRPRQRRRRGVHSQDELPGPGDCRKDDDRKHRPVQTIHRRQAGHFRITHGNGNGYRRYDDPHENILGKVSPGISSQCTKQPFRLFLLHFFSLILLCNEKRLNCHSGKLSLCVGVTGFEPATSRPPAVRSNQTEPYPDSDILSNTVEKCKHYF